ncbi:hypothetical protein AB0L86_24920 [Micromonospora musae]|uniref:hypothetical protein n=1 Tax=Micromonospora musae TaxID=1894970 RepID=UPI003432621F
MSLTSAISDDGHAVTRWMGSRLRRTHAVRAAYTATLPVRRVQRPIAAGRTVVRWDLLGTAVDFRIRCAFITPQAPPSAVAGVALAGLHCGPALQRVGGALVEAFEDHLHRTAPQRRGSDLLLDEDAEIRLDAFCFALAWFDRVYRDGVVAPGSPLVTVGSSDGVEGLVARVPDYAVMDLQVQVRLAEIALGALRDATDETACLAAPTFAGSPDVGGADADLIVGRCLIEIKSISRPELLTDKVIWQLAGYVLLDYDDAYHLDEVGFYMSRIGWLTTWPTEEFFRLLGSRVPLPRLRADFAKECRSLPGERRHC